MRRTRRRKPTLASRYALCGVRIFFQQKPFDQHEHCFFFSKLRRPRPSSGKSCGCSLPYTSPIRLPHRLIAFSTGSIWRQSLQFVHLDPLVRANTFELQRADMPHVLCSGGPGSVTYVNDVFFYLLCARLISVWLCSTQYLFSRCRLITRATRRRITMHLQLRPWVICLCVSLQLRFFFFFADFRSQLCSSVNLRDLSAPLLFGERQGHLKPALHPATEAIFFTLFSAADFKAPHATVALM